MDISKPTEKKKKKDLSFACKDAITCIPVGAIVLKGSRGGGGGGGRGGGGERRGGEGEGS